jgi:vancomycin resistance protein VanW
LSLSPRIRDALPLGLRRTFRRAQRFAADIVRRDDLDPPDVALDLAGWAHVTMLTQALGTTPNAAAKQHNIALAAAAFSARPVAPGGLFSFWGWLGAPSRARGFQDGRALRGGKLVLETGGGLCQLAGALYLAGLQAGLRTVERHAHSVDLYTDETRYAPLGSDATVSFGFKDLRLRNPHACAVAFVVCASDDALLVRVLAERSMAARVPEFRRIPMPDGSVVVETWIGGAKTASTVYKKLNSASAASPL